MSAFHTLRDKAYLDVMLSEDYFAERVLLIKDYGRSEDLSAAATAISNAIAADSYITVTISDVEEDPIIDDNRFTREEEIMVQCTNDESAVDSDANPIGGIAQPTVHDAILRTVAEDPLQLPYMFKHEIEHRSGKLWRLKFSRHLQGTQQVTG